MRARLERDFGTDFEARSEVEFEAAVNEVPGAFELVLEARVRDSQPQERRIRAATCAELVDALVAAMSLARQSLEPPPSREPPPSEPKREAESEPHAPAPPARPTEKKSTPLVPVVVLGGLVDAGALPEVAFGVETLVALEWPSVDVGVLGALTTQQEASFDGGSGVFDLAFGGGFVCYSPERSTWELSGCLAGEVGRIHGQGVDVANAREGSALWLALVPSARLRFRPGPRRFGLYVQLGATVPLVRQPFELTEIGIVHRPAPLGLRAVAGIELAFR